MRVEARMALNEKRKYITRGMILVSENNEESEIIDAVFGNQVGDDGLIRVRMAEARLADGFGEHYIYIPSF